MATLAASVTSTAYALRTIKPVHTGLTHTVAAVEHVTKATAAVVVAETAATFNDASASFAAMVAALDAQDKHAGAEKAKIDAMLAADPVEDDAPAEPAAPKPLRDGPVTPLAPNPLPISSARAALVLDRLQQLEAPVLPPIVAGDPDADEVFIPHIVRPINDVAKQPPAK